MKAQNFRSWRNNLKSSSQTGRPLRAMLKKYSINEILKRYNCDYSGISSPSLLILCSAFMVYMQYSKHKWAMGGVVDGNFEYGKYFYSELSLISLVVSIGLLSRKKIILNFLFLTCYYLSVFNFSSWFIQARPFSLHDIFRTVQLILFYPEFIIEIPPVLQFKIAFFISVPFVYMAVSFLCCQCRWAGIPHFPGLRKKCYVFVTITALTWPLGIYSNIVQYNTLAEVVNECFFDLRVQKISQQPEAISHVLGDKSYKPDSPWDFSSKNILLFIIETAPAELFPSFEELCQLTHNFWLAKHSRVFKQHYSTYPESDRSIFSIVSGRYPYLTKGDSWKEKNLAPTMASYLTNSGYATYFLSTAPLEFHNDKIMIQSLGYGNIYDVKETSSALEIVDGARVWDREKIYRFDEILIEKALSIISFHAEKKPFFLTLATQSSHAPFQIPPGDSSVTSDKEKIRLNALWQFKLIKILVEKLKNTGQLDNTVIIVTGDHGIRHEYESKLLANQRILHSLTFHVPLIIAFSDMQSSVVDNYVTSHVDIAQTVIDGVQGKIYAQKYQYHGVDLFSSPLPDRDVFFFGGDYLPAFGFVNNDGYFMGNRYNELYYRNIKFDFSSGIKKKLSDKDREYFLRKIVFMKALLQYKP